MNTYRKKPTAHTAQSDSLLRNPRMSTRNNHQSFEFVRSQNFGGAVRTFCPFAKYRAGIPRFAIPANRALQKIAFHGKKGVLKSELT